MDMTAGDRLSGDITLALLQEVHHRVANQLQGLLYLLSCSTRRQVAGSLGDTGSVVERIRHIAELNRRIYEAPMAALFSQHIDDLCAGVLASFGRPDVKLRIEFEAEPNSEARKLTIALICIELLTNALKHSLWHVQGGSMHMRLTAESDGSLRLVATNSPPERLEAELHVSAMVRLLAESAGGSATAAVQDGYVATVTFPAFL